MAVGRASRRFRCPAKPLCRSELFRFARLQRYNLGVVQRLISTFVILLMLSSGAFAECCRIQCCSDPSAEQITHSHQHHSTSTNEQVMSEHHCTGDAPSDIGSANSGSSALRSCAMPQCRIFAQVASEASRSLHDLTKPSDPSFVSAKLSCGSLRPARSRHRYSPSSIAASSFTNTSVSLRV